MKSMKVRPRMISSMFPTKAACARVLGAAVCALGLAAGARADVVDCNGNGIDDPADIANHTASDCNGNGVLDSCDIASGAAVDWNADGFPDSCTSQVQVWPPSAVVPFADGVEQIAAGYFHSGGVWSNGRVGCWGDNSFGQTVVPIGALSQVASLALGAYHSVVRRTDGTVLCWGRNLEGQCNVPASINDAIEVSAGWAHTVVRRTTGQIACYGWNAYGQCNTPSGLANVAGIAAGEGHTVAMRTDGTLACWGRNSEGQCNVPASVGIVGQVAAGWYHTVALRTDGSVACWGWNLYGQSNTPGGLGVVREVKAGVSHTMALLATGEVRCWGNNNEGQCSVPASLTGVTRIAAGGHHSVVLRSLASTPSITFGSTSIATCGLSNGAIDVTVTDAPILSWTGPSGFTSTSEDLTGLAAGTYTLTASGPGGNATLTVTVGASADTTAPSIASYTPTATIAASQDCTATIPDFVASVVATDDCTIASIAQSPLAGASVGPGVHTIALTVTDTAGNATSVDAIFTVTGSPANYYADADHDGFGTGSPITACAQPANSASVAGDQCDNDPLKQAPGVCGCGTPDTDANGNGIADCADVFLVLTPSATSVSSGGQFRVRVSASASLAPMAGLQLAMRYDHTHLRLDAVEPVAGGPFAAELAEQIDNASGTLRYALGVADGASGLTSAADLCDLQFTVLPGSSLCGSSVLVTFGNVGPFTTRFTRMTGGAQVPLVANLPPINLDSVAPVISGVPSSVSVAADAGSTYGAYVAAPTVTATDDCDGTVAVDGPSWPSDGMFPIGTTTLTWSATDSAGNTSSETRTITVGDYQLLDASIAFQGTLSGTSTRSVRIKAGLSTQVLTVNLTGNAGTLTGVQVPVAASYACIEAKDTAHTLTRTAAPSIAGTRYSSSFLLVQGDSNDDDLVDIVDFGSFVADRGAGKAKDARSNFNADTVVNNADFTYITLNFFSVGESCTGALDGAQPRDRIHVKELRRMGLGDLAAADLNGDGWVDARDMQAYMQGGGGAAPRPQAADAPPAAGGGGW